MKMKTYQAQSMSEALARVRREMGRDAVILHTRKFRKGGFLGFGGKDVVEITAGSGVNVLHPQQKRQYVSQPKQTAGIPARRNNTPASHNPNLTGKSELTQELNLVKKMVSELVAQQRKTQYPDVPEELFGTYLSLINQEVADELAEGIIKDVSRNLSSENLKDHQSVQKALHDCVSKMLPPGQPITPGRPGKPKIITFVGPTGVGKTTTIAKLAANFKIKQNQSVGLITIDTYRIAAVDQLRTYADIINVPLKVAVSPDDLPQAIEEMKNCSVILIDTAGRSQNDRIKLQELQTFLKSSENNEVHLVVSGTSSSKNLQAIVEQFEPLGVDKVVITKLDETVGVGMILNILKKLNRSVSYLTTGQSVPEDIEPGTAKKLARTLVENCQSDDKDKTRQQLSAAGES